MKKKLSFLSIVLIFLIFFAGIHRDFKLKTDQGIRIFAVHSDTTIYSEQFNSMPTMTLCYMTYDTTSGVNNDSLQLIIKYQAYLGKFLGVERWKTQDSVVVTADSTMDDWLITNSPINNSQIGRFAITGGDSNRVDYPNFGELEVKCYE